MDSSCITRYLNHPLIINFFNEMMSNAAKEDYVPTPSQILHITKILVSTIHLKAGHRKEIWGKLLLKNWTEAITGPDCAFPFLDPSQVDMEAARQTGRVMEGFTEGEEMYYRENLHRPDPVVRVDPLTLEGDTRKMLVGKVTYVKDHKTGKRYKAVLWFSLYDCCYLRAYETLRLRFLASKGMDGTDPKLPFFINSQGEAYMSKTTCMDWTWFRQINMCGKFTSHKARKIMSDYIKAQKNAILSEGKS